VCHAPDGQDLVLNHPAALDKVIVNGHYSRHYPIGTLLELFLCAYIEHCSQHIRNCQARSINKRREASTPRGLTLLADERQTPTESVHKVGKPVGVWHVVELPDAEHVRLVFDHRRLVVINVQIIRRREECHHAREPCLAALAIHAIPINNTSTQPRAVERARRLAHPESWASCARMIESK
jgi:hypothetical protein